jgi:hypothetical protein
MSKIALQEMREAALEARKQGVTFSKIDHLTHNGAIFALSQRIIIGMPRSRFCELNQQILQQFNDFMVDIFTPVI